MNNSGKKEKRYRLFIFIAVLLFVAGLLVMLFPTFTNWLYGQEVKQQRQSFEQQIEEIEKVSASDASVMPFDELYQEL